MIKGSRLVFLYYYKINSNVNGVSRTLFSIIIDALLPVLLQSSSCTLMVSIFLPFIYLPIYYAAFFLPCLSHTLLLFLFSIFSLPPPLSLFFCLPLTSVFFLLLHHFLPAIQSHFFWFRRVEKFSHLFQLSLFPFSLNLSIISFSESLILCMFNLWRR